MTHAEALKVAIEVLGEMGGAMEDGNEYTEAAARLERLVPFVEAVASDQPYGQVISDPLKSGVLEAMATSIAEEVKWTDCSCEDGVGTCWYHLHEIERARSLVLAAIRAAYRALSTEETTKP